MAGHSISTPEGQKLSLEYNEEKFLESCQTMLICIRRPPLVSLHFFFISYNEKSRFIYSSVRYFFINLIDFFSSILKTLFMVIFANMGTIF